MRGRTIGARGRTTVVMPKEKLSQGLQSSWHADDHTACTLPVPWQCGNAHCTGTSLRSSFTRCPVGRAPQLLTCCFCLSSIPDVCGVMYFSILTFLVAVCAAEAGGGGALVILALFAGGRGAYADDFCGAGNYNCDYYNGYYYCCVCPAVRRFQLVPIRRGGSLTPIEHTLVHREPFAET